MKGLKVAIIAFVDPWQPGFVRCSFTDANGIEKFVFEKAPVVAMEHLDQNSSYPRDGIIAGEILHEEADEFGDTIITFSTEKPWSIETEEGEMVFKVRKDQVIDFD